MRHNYSYNKDLLNNGLVLVTVDMPHIHSVDVVLYLRCGSRFENARNNGISHFLEHTILRGSEGYPTSKKLHRAFENIGGELNGATSGECLYLCYHHHPDFFKEGMSAFADILKKPIFNDFEIEKKIVIEEILADKNTDGEIIDIDSIACKAMWPDHSLGLGTLGPKENIESFQREDVIDYYKRFFVPENMVLCCSGNLNREAVSDCVSKAIGDLPGTDDIKSFKKSDYKQKNFEVVFVNSPEPKADVQICFRGLSYNDQRFLGLILLKRVFSDGVGSRLNYAIREQEGLVYDISSSVSPFYDTGSFDIDFSVANENIAITIEKVFDEICKLLRFGVAEDELKMIKRRYSFDLDYSIDSPYKMCSRYGWSELFSIPVSHEKEGREVEKISAEEILNIARDVFKPSNLNVISVGLISETQRAKIRNLVESFCSRLVPTQQ